MHKYTSKCTGRSMAVPVGHPHGDAWGFIRGYKVSHDVDRYLEAQKKKQKQQKQQKEKKR